MFILAAALLFHTHPYGLAPVVALGGLAFIYRPFADKRRWIWIAAPAVALLTLPWLALSSVSSSGSALNTTAAQSVGEFLERCTQAFIEFTSVTPLIGTAILLIAAFLIHWKTKTSGYQSETAEATTVANSQGFWETNEPSILICVLATAIVYALYTAITQSSDSSGSLECVTLPLSYLSQ
jgi:hypothetical protein